MLIFNKTGIEGWGGNDLCIVLWSQWHCGSHAERVMTSLYHFASSSQIREYKNSFVQEVWPEVKCVALSGETPQYTDSGTLLWTPRRYTRELRGGCVRSIPFGCHGRSTRWWIKVTKDDWYYLKREEEKQLVPVNKRQNHLGRDPGTVLFLCWRASAHAHENCPWHTKHRTSSVCQLYLTGREGQRYFGLKTFWPFSKRSSSDKLLIWWYLGNIYLFNDP